VTSGPYFEEERMRIAVPVVLHALGNRAYVRWSNALTVRFASMTIAGVAVWLAACSDPGPEPQASRVAKAMVVVSGSGQSAVVNTALPNPLVVRVVDSSSVAVAQQTASFRVLQGGGTLSQQTTMSDADGLASVQWTLGKSTADSQVVEVVGTSSVTGAQLAPVRFVATALPGAPAKLVRFAGDSQAALAGTALAESLAVRVEDSFSNPVTGVVTRWQVLRGGGRVSPDSVATVADGVARVVWTLGGRLDVGHEVVAEAAGVSTVASFLATALLDSAAHVVVVLGDAQTQTVGQALADSLTVRVVSADSTPLGGVPVSWRDVTGRGTVSATESVTGTDGRTSVAWTLGTVAGEQQVEATASGLRDSTVTVTATGIADAPDTLAIVRGNNQQGHMGQALLDSLGVRVADGYGNPVGGTSVTWTVTEGGGSVSPVVTVATEAGYAATRWTLGGGGQQTLTASAAGRTAEFAATMSDSLSGWDPDTIVGAADFGKVWRSPTGTVYALDATGTLFRFGADSAWTVVTQVPGVGLFGCGAQACLGGLSGSADDDIWMGFLQGLYRWDGQAAVKLGNWSIVTDLQVVSPSEVYVAGLDTTTSSSVLVYRWDGVAWDTLPRPLGAFLPRSVWATDGTVFVGDQNSHGVFRYAQGSWDTIYVHSAGYADVIRALSPTDVYFAIGTPYGNRGLLHFDGGPVDSVYAQFPGAAATISGLWVDSSTRLVWVGDASCRVYAVPFVGDVPIYVGSPAIRTWQVGDCAKVNAVTGIGVYDVVAFGQAGMVSRGR
jgi:ubiquinone biosynthesis protein UbiJ